LGDLALIGKKMLELSIINHINYITSQTKESEEETHDHIASDSDSVISKLVL
jgi:hypothetical protein